MAVQGKYGSLIADPEAQSHRWAEYFEDLLKPATAEVYVCLLDQEEQALSSEYLSEDDQSPSLFEFEEAIKKLENYKSAGLDEIFNEQLKYGGPGLLPWLRQLFEGVWNCEKTPSDMKEGIIAIIPKKGEVTYCSFVTTTEVSFYNCQQCPSFFR